MVRKPSLAQADAGGLDMTCAEGLPDFAAVQDGACLCSWF